MMPAIKPMMITQRMCIASLAKISPDEFSAGEFARNRSLTPHALRGSRP